MRLSVLAIVCVCLANILLTNYVTSNYVTSNYVEFVTLKIIVKDVDNFNEIETGELAFSTCMSGKIALLGPTVFTVTFGISRSNRRTHTMHNTIQLHRYGIKTRNFSLYEMGLTI